MPNDGLCYDEAGGVRKGDKWRSPAGEVWAVRRNPTFGECSELCIGDYRLIERNGQPAGRGITKGNE